MTTIETTTEGRTAPPARGGDAQPVLTVRDLEVAFVRGEREIRAVNGMTYTVRAGRMLAIIGESGSGKSVSVRALMGLLPPSAYVSGSATLGDVELIGRSERSMRAIRGNDIAMVFQDPARSLNPTMSVGSQIVEAVRAHEPLSRRQAADRAIELLTLVRLPAPERRFHEYPHQLSGGMRQRVMIAIALAADPKVLIADEATTALDVTTQAQIMELIVDLQQRLGTAVVMISHDLGLAASYADEVLVMYAGRVVEQASSSELFGRVRMPYTAALLGAIPQLTTPSHSQLTVIGGQPPDLGDLPEGCAFRERCPRAVDACGERPPLEEHEPGHAYACWHPVATTAEGLTAALYEDAVPPAGGVPDEGGDADPAGDAGLEEEAS